MLADSRLVLFLYSLQPKPPPFLPSFLPFFLSPSLPPFFSFSFYFPSFLLSFLFSLVFHTSGIQEDEKDFDFWEWSDITGRKFQCQKSLQCILYPWSSPWLSRTDVAWGRSLSTQWLFQYQNVNSTLYRNNIFEKRLGFFPSHFDKVL